MEIDIHLKASNALEILQSSHTQSMLFRGDTIDNNPVIDSMNGTMESLSINQKKMKFWLYMGPKVLEYQKLNHRDEIEPPLDDTDRNSLLQKIPVGNFISDNEYRYSIPVILGKNNANHQACIDCHGIKMNMLEGEVIGGLSILYNFETELEELDLFLLELIILFTLFLSLIAIVIIKNINRLVTQPISNMTKIISNVIEKNESVLIPQHSDKDSIEIIEILNAIGILHSHNMSQLDELNQVLNMHTIVAKTNLNGKITYVNQKFIDVSGYSESELIGSDHNIVSSGYHTDSFYKDMYSTIQSGEIWTGELCNKNKSGERFWVDSIIVPLLDFDGIPTSYITVRTDITAAKKAQLAMKEAKIAAEESLNAKSSFLASMSHEIRTPMNGVLGMLGLLLGSKLSEEQQRRAKIAESSAKSLLSLINDILDFSKIDAGKLELEYIEFNLQALLSELAETFALQAHDKDLELILNIIHCSHKNVIGDPNRLRQILTNIIGNALKFTVSGEIIIEASVSSLEAANNEGESPCQFECKIIDTGIGIPEDKINNLFDSFSQVDASTTRKYGGTGLGLAIVKQLCELMNGSISVYSEIDVGTVFTVTIPLKKSNKPIYDIPTVDLTNLSFLIVDDNATNREVLRGQLENWGGVIEGASSAKQAIKMCQNKIDDEDAPLYDIAFVDMQMPEMDGSEFGEIIRNNDQFNGLSLILMTSMDQTGDKQFFADLGFQAYFRKPATPSDIVDAIAIIIKDSEMLKSSHIMITDNYLKTLNHPNDVDNSEPDMPLLGKKCLLVEDNKINQMVASALLKKLGVNISIANNGKEAIDILSQSSSYDIVIMDCQMPILDGYEATKRIRSGEVGKDNITIPIIAMTANAMIGDKEKCLEVGMNDYLSKPVDIKELSAKLHLFIPK